MRGRQELSWEEWMGEREASGWCVGGGGGGGMRRKIRRYDRQSLCERNRDDKNKGSDR